MDFATIFRLEENLNLDKKTLVFLRWIAIFGQLFSINLVYFFLNLNFPVLICHIIIFIGFLTNIFLQFGFKARLLKLLHEQGKASVGQCGTDLTARSTRADCTRFEN